MNLKKTGAGILGVGTLVMGSVDAAVLNEKPLERVEMVAHERVEARQIENRIETTFPWKDQKGLKVVAELGEPTISERLRDKRKKEVVTEVVDFGDGGFKVDILLNEKPDTNRFCYMVKGAENYDFFYQPEITDEEAEATRLGKTDTRSLEEIKRSIRPEEIVGSYAVYHKELKNHRVGGENYATGKVMHIPRPQVWSLATPDEKIWADLFYEDGELCVTTPQSFLDSATYPVRVDPTFGYTGGGASNLSFAGKSAGGTTLSQKNAGASTPSEDGALNALSAYLVSSASASLGAIAEAGDRNSASTNNHHVVSRSSEVTQSLTTTPAWKTIALGGEGFVAGNELVINMRGDPSDLSNGVSTSMRYDSASAIYGTLSRPTFNDADFTDNPFFLFLESDNLRISIYATYTASGGGGATSVEDVIFFD